MSKALQIATDSLRANIVSLASGRFLVAGQNQFRTLWTRDFCHAVGGLLAIGEEQVVKDHLSFLLRSLRSDGLVPRVIDNRVVQLRVAWESARKLLPFLPHLSIHEPLRPQYVDEHGSAAIDSNLLVILAALKLRATSPAWWDEHEAMILKAWAWYDDKLVNGLIWQTGFSDWQDSAQRLGHSFLTNLFYFQVLSQLKTAECEAFKQLLLTTFFDPPSGVFLSLKGSPVVSIEGNLMALMTPDLLSTTEQQQLWQALKRHSLLENVGGLIGSCGTPEWPSHEIAWHVRLAKLHRYHGELVWSWLMGLGLKAGFHMADHEFCQKQKNKIVELLERDHEVVEIYDPKLNWQPWESWLLRAERPFSWGAGHLVEALANS